LLKTPAAQRLGEQGLVIYCGTFEVRDGRVIHHMEFGISPILDGC
jgi:hypothetical protein